MLAGLTERRWRVQHFRTRACPTATEAVGQVTGLPGRHLDAWLMPPPVCRAPVRSCGPFDRTGPGRRHARPSWARTGPCTPCDCPGELKPIAEILDLPIVAVVSCREIEAETCHLPRLPDGVDAVLLDGLADPAALPRLKRLFQLTAKLPVIGAIENLPAASAAFESPAAGRPAAGGADRRAGVRVPKARRPRSHPRPGTESPIPEVDDESCLSHRRHCRPAVQVAYAHDDAFGGYFPDTLEALEALEPTWSSFHRCATNGCPTGLTW